MMKLAIMQPYLFPYIGYFQLMNAVDEFVVYDNIEYTKKGWINRNRVLVNGKDEYISFPLKKDSDYLHICDRSLADSWYADQKKVLNRIKESYRKTPFFTEAFPVIESCITYPEQNLFKYILHSLEILKGYLGITTPLVVSSTLQLDHSLRSEEKVIAICHVKNATTYINPIGGLTIYSDAAFKNNNINLQFLRTGDVRYQQFDNEFVPMLSIIDVMMFNSVRDIKAQLDNYTLQQPVQ